MCVTCALADLCDSSVLNGEAAVIVTVQPSSVFTEV